LNTEPTLPTDPDERSPLSPRNVAIGLGLFVVFTAAGLAVVAWWAGRSDAEVVSEITHAKTTWLLLALALTATEALAGGFRIWVLARETLPGFRVRDGLRTHLYLLFAAGVTPMQLGGGPAQYVVLRARGLRPHDALAVLSISWVGGRCSAGARRRTSPRPVGSTWARSWAPSCSRWPCSWRSASPSPCSRRL